MHTHHTMHKAVLAPGPCLLTQVPAIVRDPSTLLGVLLFGLNSKLVNRLLSVPWLGGYIPSMEGWGGQADSRSQDVCVCVCVFVCAP